MGILLNNMRTTVRHSGDSALDRTIISRCKNRDAEAFSIIVDQYQARIYGFVRRMLRNTEDAEDVAQEVFIKAFENFDRFDGRASLSTWLFKIASNLCIDRARKRGRRPELVSLEPGNGEGIQDAADLRWDPQSSVVTSEMEQAIEEALAQLSEKLRSVLLLHDLEELSYEEISKAVGIPVGTVKSRLFLARNQLQQALRRYLIGEARQ